MLSELWPEPDPLRVSGGSAAYSVLVGLPSQGERRDGALESLRPALKGNGGDKTGRYNHKTRPTQYQFHYLSSIAGSLR